MILGVLDRNMSEGSCTELLMHAAGSSPADGPRPGLWAENGLAMCALPRNIATLDETSQPYVGAESGVVLVFAGKIYNLAELQGLIGGGAELRAERSGEALLRLYEKFGDDFLEQVNGKFAFALWDSKKKRLLLGRDRLGIEPLFYFHNGSRLVFGSSLWSLAATGLVDRTLNRDAILQYLLYCYNPSSETVVRGVHKVPPGRLLSLDASGLSIKRYWFLSFGDIQEIPEARYKDEILGQIDSAIKARIDSNAGPGVFLSGGTDSSAIVAMASKQWPEPLNTFSFRCAGRSYDESSYARMVAEHFGTNHTEVPFEPPERALLERVVGGMDEPFCDVGIELATFLLGQAAEGKVSYVFSGEGGDELFAGHPVYTADKVAEFVDLVPRAITGPFAKLFQSIPDSDEKRNLQVKLKRFAYSMAFPPALLSHRWRIYYTPEEIRQICQPDFVAEADPDRMYDFMIDLNKEADGPDSLSRSLYSDHFTLIDFYLRRLGLLRGFNIESRVPLMDHKLIEYAARVPANMKLRGMSHTKYIYRKALTGTVPRQILYDRPKLGHSVPMKNWLREEDGVGGWLDDVLFDGTLKESGLFDLDFVKTLVTQHRRKSHNHSHRLWALGVLALWLAKWRDQSVAAAAPRQAAS